MMSVSTDIMFCFYFHFELIRGGNDEFKHFLLIFHYEFLNSCIS